MRIPLIPLICSHYHITKTKELVKEKFSKNKGITSNTLELAICSAYVEQCDRTHRTGFFYNETLRNEIRLVIWFIDLFKKIFVIIWLIVGGFVIIWFVLGGFVIIWFVLGGFVIIPLSANVEYIPHCELFVWVVSLLFGSFRILVLPV